MNHKKILLVEDNRDDETLILMALEKSGVGNEVDVVRDGQEALDYLFCAGDYARRGRDEPPAVVLLDLKLPKMDGLEVLRRLRAEARTRSQPVVVLTSSDESRDRLRSYDLGANSYVCKPLDFLEFTEAVKALGLYWILLNRTPWEVPR